MKLFPENYINILKIHLCLFVVLNGGAVFPISLFAASCSQQLSLPVCLQHQYLGCSEGLPNGVMIISHKKQGYDNAMQVPKEKRETFPFLS